jgi:hypothetical protein
LSRRTLEEEEVIETESEDMLRLMSLILIPSGAFPRVSELTLILPKPFHRRDAMIRDNIVVQS